MLYWLFGLYCLLCSVVIVLLSRRRAIRRKAQRAEIQKQFEAELAAFKATGLTRESRLDMEINDDISKRAAEIAEEADNSKNRLYIIKCLNSKICPVCGEENEMQEIGVPLRPGVWDILKRCTNCGWQCILSDLG